MIARASSLSPKSSRLRMTDEFVSAAAEVTANDPVYDLEDTHSANEPRVRRLKAPHAIHLVYMRASRHPKVVELLTDLWGQPACRHRQAQHEVGRLLRADPEWHQDWAFYPHTSAAHRTSREIRAPVYVQGLTGDRTPRYRMPGTPPLGRSPPVAPCGRTGLSCRRPPSASPDRGTTDRRRSHPRNPASRPNTDCRSNPTNRWRRFLPVRASPNLSPPLVLSASTSSSSRYASNPPSEVIAEPWNRSITRRSESAHSSEGPGTLRYPCSQPCKTGENNPIKSVI
jgi:hypothetical protein